MGEEKQSNTSLQQLAIRGSIWTVAGYGASQFIRLVNNIILTRLLKPELFGLMALVYTFITGLNLFSDIGINPSIIRSPRGEDSRFLNTAWTLQVIRGITLWLICFVIAMPIANFYKIPELSWLIPVVGSNTFIAGFNSTSLAVLNRRVEIGKLTVMEIVTQIIAVVVMIAIALYKPTIWALVLGTLVANIVKLFWSHLLSSTPHTFLWDRDCLKELFSFGRWIFVATAITFLANQTDRLVIGKLLPLEILGVYTIAFTFADIPRQIVNRLSDKVIFPLVSHQLQVLPRDIFLEKLLEKRRHLLALSALMVAFFFCFSDIIIDILYDERYRDAGWMFAILTLGLWPLILSISTGQILLSLGKPQYHTLSVFIKFLYMITVFPFAIIKFNLFWGIIAIGFNDMPNYSVSVFGLWREGFSFFRQDLFLTIVLLSFIFVFALSRLLLFFLFSLPLPFFL
ncbi:MAG: oligosaccharide flippase family protein [Geminocystis sp.]|nr:oligosaccharide flippase family protein [Geminocystis sp.]HIK38765.1 oligosaccharide flippase family protein [Geminocystis sp. M7585_C2015_104]MCS7147886.1 oligosaccharide flippase family protein [Geminocystis sp.]MCX8078712.1 oligosaccharide flippase family protein [Geminocystis sp.]MDW8117026.1 oligosaccharide flippase family protein [Geminocystis sp.]